MSFTAKRLTGITMVMMNDGAQEMIFGRGLAYVAIEAQGYDWSGRDGLGESVYMINGKWEYESGVWAAIRAARAAKVQK